MTAFENIQRNVSDGLNQLHALASAVEDEVARIRAEALRQRDALRAKAEAEAEKLRESLQREVSAALETVSKVGKERVAEALTGLDIAAASELRKLNRKLDRISKRVRDLERKEETE